MAKKPTTSDVLKLVFQYAVENNPADWTRTAKSKNEAGQWVREFESKSTGERLIVTETGNGQFNIKGTGLEANISIPPGFFDSPASRAADLVMELALHRKPVPDDLLKTASKELANKFVFTVITNDANYVEKDVDYVVIITPAAPGYDDMQWSRIARGCIGDSLAPAERYDDCGGDFWSFPKEFDTPAKIIQTLTKKGLVWDFKKQQADDPKILEQMKAAAQAKRKNSGPRV